VARAAEGHSNEIEHVYPMASGAACSCSPAASVAGYRRRHTPRSQGTIAAASSPSSSSDSPFEVPVSAFLDGLTPEAKAAKALKLLFTMVAVRVVLAQEEGFGNECHDDPDRTELHDGRVRRGLSWQKRTPRRCLS
jgi:hypothetical protein